MPSDAVAILAYFGGIAAGVMLTLVWQTHAASVRRQLWDFYASLPEDHQ